jgi:hypothetical protein
MNAATPTYAAVVPDLSWLWWIVAAAVPLLGVFLVFFVLASESKKHAGAYAGVAIGGLMLGVFCVIGPLMVSIQAEGDAGRAHSKQVTAWLASEYGAKADITEVNGGFLSGDPFPAVVNGEPRMIRVAKGPNNRLLVFGTDDKPLPVRR